MKGLRRSALASNRRAAKAGIVVAAYTWASPHSRIGSLFDFTARRAWLLLPLAAAGAGAAYAVAGAAPVVAAGLAIGLLIALLIGLVLERRGRLLRSADDLQAF